MNKLLCPTCRERLVKAGEYLYRCEKCSEEYISIDGVISHVYMTPVNLSQSIALDTLLLWIKKRLGVPEETYFKADITSSVLMLLPYWLVIMEGKADYSGLSRDAEFYGIKGISLLEGLKPAYRYMRRRYRETSGQVERVVSYAMPATSREEFGELDVSREVFINEVLRNVRIPSEMRIYFDRERYKQMNTIIVDVDISPEEARKRAVEEARRRVLSVIGRSCEDISELDISIDVKQILLIYIPIWIFKYEIRMRGKKREYLGIVDASIGRVLYTTYPVGLRYRLVFIIAGAVHVLIGLGIAYLLKAPPYTVLGLGLSTVGIPLLIRGFMRGRGEEE